jgi:uncharacterized membrane protein
LGPATSDRGELFTALDFIEVSKYPPSLDFLLLTLGAALIVLALSARARGRIARSLVMLGRAPMFFYLLHLPLAHLVGNAWSAASSAQPSLSQTTPSPSRWSYLPGCWSRRYSPPSAPVGTR